MVTTDAERASWKADLDAMIGVYEPARPTTADYRAPAGHGVSGRWLGCWINLVHQLGPSWMDLELEVEDSPQTVKPVRAVGTDRLGAFRMNGAIHEETRTINFAKEYTPAVGLAAARAIAYSGFIDDDAIRGVYTVNGTTSHLFALYHVLALDPDVAAKKARAAQPAAARAHLELAVSLLTLPLRWPAVARRAKLAERVRAMMGA